MPGYRKQQGLALITVLLVFAIVTLLATNIIDRQATDVQRSANMFTFQQSRALTYAAEEAIRVVLYEDWKDDKTKDTLNDQWNGLGQNKTGIHGPYPIGDGKITGYIIDAQGRFNLNSLSPDSANKAVQQQRFSNLLKLIGLDAQLASSVSRWMDKESQVDNVYEALEPAYRAAYQGCSHTSELLLVEEFSAEAYQKLLPYITCLPIEVQLNVNTASAAVLASLGNELTLQDGESLVSSRGKDGFASLDDFWNQDILKRYTEPQNTGNDNNQAEAKWQKGDFAILTEYFELFARADLAERYATSEILIKRDKGDGRTSIVYRDYSRREQKPKARVPGQQNSNTSQYQTGSS
jgi:general secretion pathway protein K